MNELIKREYKMQELYVGLGTDLKDVCEKLHDNPGSYTIFNEQKLTSNMTNDEMYLAVTKMTEAEYTKFLADKMENIQKKIKESTLETGCPSCGSRNMRIITIGLTKETCIKCASCGRKIKFPHPEEESLVSQNTDTIKSKFDDDEIKMIEYALDYLHDADLSLFRKGEIMALESVMNKFHMKFSSVVDSYYMDDGSKQH